MKRVVLLASILAAIANVGAAPYQLTFSGTYSISTLSHGSLFGVSDLPVPFTYTIIYDTALNTNPYVFPTGSMIGSYPAAAPFFGYSASGILGTSLTFGTQTWTKADLLWANMSPTIGADLWFNADLEVETPTQSWIVFDVGGAGLEIGTGALMGGGVGYLSGRSTVHDDYGPVGEYLAFDTTIQRVPLAAVPEHASPILIPGVALLLLAGIRRRRAVSSRP